MIDSTKTYKTKDGNKARFLGEVKSADYPLIFAITHGDGYESTQSYNLNGRFYSDDELSDADLVEYNPMEDLVQDQPIYVRSTLVDEWVPRHFAYIKEGRVWAYINGCTSFTCLGKGNTTDWKYFRLKD